MNKWNEDLFDESKIQQAMRKGKRKSIWNMVRISLIVFIVLIVCNFAMTIFFSERSFKQLDAYTRLTTPNGYITESTESLGILGGNRQYKIAKDMKVKSVVIEQKEQAFGLLPINNLYRGAGGRIGVTGEDWQVTYKENGWKNLLFFHPLVKYEKYYKDEETWKSLDDDSIYEVAFSFDQAYSMKQLPIFALSKMTWLWVDSYDENQVQSFQEEANSHDWTGTFIDERDTLGFSIYDPLDLSLVADGEYEYFLSLLETSNHREHQDAYKLLKNQSVDEINILGVVLYGTKEELQKMVDLPMVKAFSVGGYVKDY